MAAALSGCSGPLEQSLTLTSGITLSHLGIVTEADSLSTWYIAGCEALPPIHEDYMMLTGKRLHCTNDATVQRYVLTDSCGHTQHLEVRQYADGIALRYTLDDGYDQPCRLLGEQTELQLAPGTNRWLMKWSDSYEGFYPLNPELEAGTRMGMPALFESPDGSFTLLTEANIERHHAASSYYVVDSLQYRIVPDQTESLVGRGYTTPWRVLIHGSLPTVTESTLVTDLSQPCQVADTSWMHPGVVSWIYWAYNHGSSDYDIITQYVDMAVALHLPYVLIDAEWDEMPQHSRGHQSIEDALRYAISRGIQPMIWYNSCCGWIDGAPGPKWRLNDPAKREQEFAWCEEHGVRGVKIDFFGGDTEAVMDYCQDLLESAARHHLLVNFHGATIPRGWMRTYPHLMSTEGVYGAEWYNNKAHLTQRAAAHNATLPFTRGVVGSMDYTPCTFSDSQHPHITTHAHELALTVLFESALLHLADRPSAYLSQPQEVQQMLGSLPTVWDETRLLAGYPGHHVLMARRHGSTWYVAGINGTEQDLSLSMAEVSALLSSGQTADGTESRQWLLFEDSGISGAAACPDPWRISRPDSLPDSVRLFPRGGFVLIGGTEGPSF